jgi:hypothetical protein
MMIMIRDRDYADLVGGIDGRSVLVWTCNTCARLCNGIGGQEAAGRLAERLRADGIRVTGVLSTSASCLEGKVAARASAASEGGPELVLVLACDLGARCAGAVLGREVLNPVETLGTGYLRADGRPVLLSAGDRSALAEDPEMASPCLPRSSPYA